ncbi:MAG: hypothetical protein AAGN66_03625 [Acidobacteriota bacterium]
MGNGVEGEAEEATLSAGIAGCILMGMDKASVLSWSAVVLGVLAGLAIGIYGMPELPVWAWVLLLLLILVGITAGQISANLPAQLRLDPIPDFEPTEAMEEALEEVKALGFRTFGAPSALNLQPSAVLVSLINEEALSYSSVYVVGGPKQVLGWDFVAMFQEPRGGLTTVPRRDGAALRHSPGELIQVFEDATPEQAFQRHLETLVALQKKGLRVEPVAAEGHAERLAASSLHKRQHFFRNPVLGAWVALWRVVTRSTPHMGPILDQKVGAKEVERMLAQRGLEGR